MSFQILLDGQPAPWSLGKVVCVGRNYAEHAKELNNPLPKSPILFIKPASAVVPFADTLEVPAEWGECHHEVEMALLIGKSLTKASEAQAQAAIVGYGVALDLTLRELQSQLKANGHPWEMAKSFDGACPMSGFVSSSIIEQPQACDITLSVNGQLRQAGNTLGMLTPMVTLVAYMSRFFTLNPGDVVLTGTPAGVASLHDGDTLRATLAGDQVVASATLKRP